MKYGIRYYQAITLGTGHHNVAHNEHGWGYWVDQTGHLVWNACDPPLYEDINAAYRQINSWPVKTLLGVDGLYYLVEEYP